MPDGNVLRCAQHGLGRPLVLGLLRGHLLARRDDVHVRDRGGRRVPAAELDVPGRHVLLGAVDGYP
jgi:hypothetical protein